MVVILSLCFIEGGTVTHTQPATAILLAYDASFVNMKLSDTIQEFQETSSLLKQQLEAKRGMLGHTPG